MNVEIPRFEDIMKWLKDNNATSLESAHNISKIGGRSKFPFFLAWVENDVIRLMPNPEARTQTGYTLQNEEWNAFIGFRRKLSAKEKAMARTFATRFTEWGCTNRIYYPAIPAVSWQYFSEADK